MKILTSLFPKLLKFCEIPGKIRSNLTKKMQNLLPPLKISKKCMKFCKNGAKVLKNHRNLEWCKGKNVELEKC